MALKFKVGDSVYFEDRPEIFEIREVSNNPRTKTPYRIDFGTYWVSEKELAGVNSTKTDPELIEKKVWLIEHRNYGVLGKLTDLDMVDFILTKLPEHAEPFFNLEYAERFLNVLCSSYTWYNGERVAFKRDQFKIVGYDVTWKKRG